MPLGAKCNSIRIWDPIIEKFDARLSVWRRISLSRGVITFWNDCWCGKQPLSSSEGNWKFQNKLFKLTRNKNACIADMISSEGNWKFDFRRVLSYTEAKAYAVLITTISDVPPVRHGLTDTRRWKLHPSGVFIVKSLYSQLVAKNGVPHFPSHFIQQQAIPPKICFLMWCFVHDKLNTIDMLQKKGMSLHNDCALCGGGEESQNHLFLHCKLAYKIWCHLTPTTGWTWVLPGSMRALADTWHTKQFSQSGNYI
ncbi:uncharacterized protein LOC113311333 [Papaver somniferum]|uniref:uncharacterized protein LOC113311333 n=1 Tax=Papaver somniferum TaxID=3469 RepID=UPI000E6F527F|nr:uncharacterized protein LOC113311333 [Papaver somniferum]